MVIFHCYVNLPEGIYIHLRDWWEDARHVAKKTLEPRLLRLQCLLPLLHQMSLQESWRHQIQEDISWYIYIIYEYNMYDFYCCVFLMPWLFCVSEGELGSTQYLRLIIIPLSGCSCRACQEWDRGFLLAKIDVVLFLVELRSSWILQLLPVRRTALQMLLKMTKIVEDNPSETKFRRIKMANPARSQFSAMLSRW